MLILQILWPPHCTVPRERERLKTFSASARTQWTTYELTKKSRNISHEMPHNGHSNGFNLQDISDRNNQKGPADPMENTYTYDIYIQSDYKNTILSEHLCLSHFSNYLMCPTLKSIGKDFYRRIM